MLDAAQEVTRSRLARDFRTSVTFDRFEAWRDAVAFIYEVARRRERQDFHLDTVSYRLGDLLINRAAGTPIVLQRESETIASRPFDYVSVFVCLEGRIEARYADETTVLAAGESILTDYSRSFRSVSTNFVGLTLMIPRAKAPVSLRSGEHHGLVFSQQGAGGALVVAATSALFDVVDDMTFGEAEASTLAIFELLAGLAPPSSRPDGGQVALQSFIDRFVRPHIARADLSAAFLGDASGLTQDAVRRLFSGHGGISWFVFALRMEIARRHRLIHPSTSDRVLARTVGFANVSAFKAGFRRHFGFALEDLPDAEPPADPILGTIVGLQAVGAVDALR